MTRSWTPGLAPVPTFLLAAAGLGGVALAILATPGYAARPDVVAPALAVDLIVGFPLLGYVFLVRTERFDPVVLAPLALLGLLLSRWWIPEAHLDASSWGLAPVLIVESVLLGTLVLRARAVRRAYLEERGLHPYRRDAVRAAMAGVLGSGVASAVMGEVEALTYAVGGWRRPRAPRAGTPFPGHRRGGYPAILAALLLALAVETVVVHLVVAEGSVLAAWILSGLSIYSAVWLVGDFHAARHNPTLLTGDTLHLRTGLRWHTDVPLVRIRGVSTARPDESTVDFILFGSPDLWIELDEPTVVQGPFGIRRRARHLGVGVDGPDGLAEALETVADRTP